MTADLPGGARPGEPGLDQLFGVLTSGPEPAELAGESAALTMFRANPQPAATAAIAAATSAATSPAAAPASTSPASSGWRGLRRHGRRAGRLAAALTVALVGGFAAAAYTEVLPAPAQHVAYRVLGFAGVPDVHRSTPGAGGAPAPGATHLGGPAPVRGASPAAGSPRRSAGAGPSASPTARPTASRSRSAAAAQVILRLTVARGQIAAGAGDVFGGWLTGQGGAIQGAKLSLFERAPGQPSWTLAGAATTGPAGRAVLTVAELASNAVFRVTGPADVASRAVLVTVLPPVSASLTSGPHGRAYVLTASSPFAVPGDYVVLQIGSGGQWLGLRAHRLDSGDQADFVVRPHALARIYRVVLLATPAHGRSVSIPVTVPAG